MRKSLSIYIYIYIYVFLALSAPSPPQAMLMPPRPPLWVVGPLSPLAREVREGLFSFCGGFLAALGTPRLVQERPREAKSSQKT